MMILKRIILFLLITLCAGACSKQRPFHKITYDGNVYDALTGAPLEGYTVRLAACLPRDAKKDQCDEFTLASVQTDNTGHFYIHVREARSDKYFVFVSKEGSNKVLSAGPVSSGELVDKYSKIYI